MTDRTEAVPPSLSAPRPHAIRRVRRAVRAPLKHCLLALCALTMLYPVLWMVVSSLRPNSEIFRSAGLALTHPRFENYSNGWNAFSQPFSHYMINSAIVVTGAILGNLLACSLAAYAFARLEFRAKRMLFAIMLVTIMLPIHVIIVPQYVLYSELGWVNTFLPLIVPKFLATDAFFIFLMVQFIRGIPREIDEAARIDGAGHARIFFHVILPLMVPALATTAIFTFIWTWNDFYTQLIYLTDPDMYTTPLALRTFVDQQSATDWGSVFAMSVVSLVPVFLVFLAGQRFLLRGIATTGGK
ncbi:carbohydrate ABC transporter permease [Streptomyces europaeiscabiei]|uniref:carbohydrate ABC transporter permease n=1 Tax=Streptomyces TaxID=1883 RepID=UPI000A3C500C|nr:MULTISPECIES: carbohydrate ABC transporter permease [Streptomyces]MDX3589124.1 carbohydrate ABC transporter permease [Streptomyces europaeiscabiei]MDX3612351.1 carbohydrate ABC transporter permease [Streptomyces europaeiscabiei]MDX3632230.1 carbohydrate ABC transporter permease [Streptomyces europaeiscabiei]MDX3649677.1 carbohydrate ABC transporter permease [Streptomyces europaeiscabiei]WUD37169.1 carbohydrate ABC transporter permease [Streptomyces europaeiscabiei]